MALTSSSRTGRQYTQDMIHRRTRHCVRCDICADSVIRLPPTADPNTLEVHREACQRRKLKKRSTTFITKELTMGGQVNTRVSVHEPAATKLRNTTKVTPLEATFICPGQGVIWVPGSIWETYPFSIHKSLDAHWRPCRFDKKTNHLVFRAKGCWKRVQEADGDITPCIPCQHIPRSTEFKVVMECARNVKDRAPWVYLTDQQKEALLRRMAATIRQLQTQVCSSYCSCTSELQGISSDIDSGRQSDQKSSCSVFQCADPLPALSFITRR